MRWATIAFGLTFFPDVVCAQSFSWTQYAPTGLEARAVTTETTCPAAEIDGASVVMQVRAKPNEAFPVLACAMSVPPAAKTVKVGGVLLAAAPSMPKRIAVFGDTGCRLKGHYVQACNDPQQWPFRQIAEMIAGKKPDLIIHVGDYHYRETACPGSDAGCANSPFGDNWDAWRTDFFAPATGLLPVAPWVMVRGNHEECERGGQGWSRTLEAQPFDEAKGCNGSSPPFIARFSQLALAVIDNSAASEPVGDDKLAEVFRAQYASLAQQQTSTPIWLLQHRPIWSTGGVVAGLPFGDNKTLALAARGTLPAQVQLMLSGHHHIFQVLGYAEDLPTQVVVGHGGDYLNKGRAANPAGWPINGVTVKSGVHQTGQFGFAMIESDGADWVITNYDRTGAPLHRCGLKGRDVNCTSE